MPAHRGRQRPAVFAGGAALALALLVPACAVAAPCHIKVAELPVQMVGTRAIATVGINGQQVPLIVDTGAFFSFLNESAAAQLGLKAYADHNLSINGINGRVIARVTTVDRLTLSKGSIPKVEFVVGGNEMADGAMGLLGRNLLSFADTEYDLAHGMIRFMFPEGDCEKTNMAYWASDPAAVARVDLISDYDVNLNRQPLLAKAKLNGRNLTVEFDTGATTTVSLAAARNSGVHESEMTPDGDLIGAGKGKARAWTGVFDSFALGDEQISHTRLQVGDFDLPETEMLLGVDFFLSHHIYVSDVQRKVYFTYNGGPVFAQNKAARASAAALAASGGTPGLDADAYLRRGAASRARGDLDAALADLDHACTLAPKNAACFEERAAVREDMEQPDAALADLNAALAVDPGLSSARLRRAWMQYHANAIDAMLADLAELDRTLPPSSPMRASMAQLYADVDQPALALPQLDRWIESHPHDIGLPDALDSRCRARVLLGTGMDKALSDCEDAIRLDGSKVSYLDDRAWVQVRRSDWKKAKTDFDWVLRSDPAFASALYGRSIAQSWLGNTEASKADLATALKLDPAIVEKLRKRGLKAED